MIEKADIPLGTAAMTVPLWMADVHPWLVEFGLWGGGILIILHPAFYVLRDHAHFHMRN